MKKARWILAALMAAAMIFSAACGEKTPEPSVPAGDEPETAAAEPTPEPTPAPQAVLDPAEIEWGYQAPGISDAQYWYVDGDKTAASFLFFEDDYLTTVDGETRNTMDTKIVDKHIVDAETNGGAFDFVFTDVLTCYDLVSNQWYKRADYETLVQSLTGTTFVCEAGSQWKFTFHADGTMTYDDDGTIKTGTWWIENARMLCNHYDDEPEGVGGWMEITYEDAGWNVKSIKDTDVFYPGG